MKKKLIALFLCAAVSLSLGACGDADTNDTQIAAESTFSEPKVVQMASYENLNEVLSGDYEITDEVLESYAINMFFTAGVGLREVTDRDVVQEGDIVKTDYTGYLDGVAFSGGAATDQWIDVSGNAMINSSNGQILNNYIEGFTDGLIGAKKGEVTEGEVTFPEGYSEDLGGKDTVFEFKVSEIYTVMTLDDLTDEFVAENLAEKYEVSTADEYRQFLEVELAYNYVINYLLNNSEFEISEGYLDSRLNEYESYYEELYCGDLSIEEYFTARGYALESVEVEWLAALESQIKSELIFKQIVDEQGLKLDEDAHEAYVQKVLSVNSAFFGDETGIYKYTGAGSAEDGELYLKTQTAVREYIRETYRETVAE